MADAVSSIGTGIALQGRVPDYANLAYRIGQDKEIKKQKESALEAKDLEFDQTALKDLYPAYAQQILDRRKALVNQYFDDISKDGSTSGKMAAKNKFMRAKMDVAAQDAVTLNNNKRAADLIAKDKLTNIVTNQDALNNAVNKQYPTAQDWSAFNDKDLGFSADGGNIQGTAIPRINLPEYAQKQYETELDITHEDKPAPQYGARAVERTPVFNYKNEAKQKFVDEVLGDEVKFKNFLAQNKEWLKQNHPDALPSNNPDDKSRLSAQKDAVLDFSQIALPTVRKESKIERYDYPPQSTGGAEDSNSKYAWTFTPTMSFQSTSGTQKGKDVLEEFTNVAVIKPKLQGTGEKGTHMNIVKGVRMDNGEEVKGDIPVADMYVGTSTLNGKKYVVMNVPKKRKGTTSNYDPSMLNSVQPHSTESEYNWEDTYNVKVLYNNAMKAQIEATTKDKKNQGFTYPEGVSAEETEQVGYETGRKEKASSGGGGSKAAKKAKTVTQNGYTYTLNESTGNYE